MRRNYRIKSNLLRKDIDETILKNVNKASYCFVDLKEYYEYFEMTIGYIRDMGDSIFDCELFMFVLQKVFNEHNKRINLENISLSIVKYYGLNNVVRSLDYELMNRYSGEIIYKHVVWVKKGEI